VTPTTTIWSASICLARLQSRIRLGSFRKFTNEMYAMVT
jgi:hypothetical protein